MKYSLLFLLLSLCSPKSKASIMKMNPQDVVLHTPPPQDIIVHVNPEFLLQ